MKQLKYCFVLLIVLCAVSAMAQAPSGTFGYGPFTNLWDATGSHTNSSVIDGLSNYQILFVTESAKGQIGGSFNDSIESGYIDIGATIAGKISVRRGVVGASLKMEDGTMTGAFNGIAKGSAVLTFNPSAGTISNVYKLELCELGHCSNFHGNVSILLPAGVNGDWTLDTAITNVVDKLGGTGTLTLSTGRFFNYKITGSYNTKSELAKLKLVGVTNTVGYAVGSSLSLTTTNAGAGEAAMTLTALKGKVLGQTLKFQQ
jgi:hypothetical protein